jgi:alkanesulfonate monooxygenase SsuD/methylene tetrahydromethanopterin reductase-like flavin-dependent oxidoreductase (luciferase family)
VRLGVLVVPSPSTPELVARADELGFDSAWFIDSPMMFGDVYVSMGLAAARTSHITLATGVTNPVLRLAPLTASALASLNSLAPGRIVMGIGTGYTATGALDLPVARHATLRRFVNEVQGLLAGDAVVVEYPDGQSRVAGFVSKGHPGVNLTDPVAVCVAAAGPKLLHSAARYADMILLGGISDPSVVRAAIDIIRTSRTEAGLDPGGVRVAATPSAYLTDRDVDFSRPTDFDELRELLGAKSLSPAGNFSRLAEQSPNVSDDIRCDFVAARDAYSVDTVTEGDPTTRHIRRYRGYMQALNDRQRRLVTPALLRGTTVCGSARQCIEQIAALQDAGLDEVVLSPLTQHTGTVIEEFGAQVVGAVHAGGGDKTTRTG